MLCDQSTQMGVAAASHIHHDESLLAPSQGHTKASHSGVNSMSVVTQSQLNAPRNDYQNELDAVHQMQPPASKGI